MRSRRGVVPRRPPGLPESARTVLDPGDRTVPPGDRAQQWPAVVAGCAGGVGTTTVARLLGPAAVDAGIRLPRPDGRPLVLVCRATAAGTLAAVEALAAARLAEHPRPALVVVGDAPLPVPAQARARLRMLTDPARVRVVVHLPYVPGWRAVDDPLADLPVPADVRHAVAQLAAALTPLPVRVP